MRCDFVSSLRFFKNVDTLPKIRISRSFVVHRRFRGQLVELACRFHMSYKGRVYDFAQPTGARVAALQLKLPSPLCLSRWRVSFPVLSHRLRARTRSNEHAVFTYKQSLCMGQAYHAIVHGLLLSEPDCLPSCVSGRSHHSSTFQPLYGSAMVAMSCSKPEKQFVCVSSVRTASFVVVAYLEPFRATMTPDA
jgi:hypothetical protein